MPELRLYFFPGTCARVALIGLEQAGLPYATEIVRFFRGEHKAPPYLAINPKGKVPALIVDGRPLTENVAIAQYLAAVAPEAGLMPQGGGAFDDALAWSDLVWCASTLHPIVTRIRMPQIFAGPEHAPAVWQLATREIAPSFEAIDRRLAASSWMLGDTWSLVDAYVFWLWDTAVGADFDPVPFASLAAHADRMRAHPATARALAVEGAAFARFAEEGTPFGLPPSAKPTLQPAV